MITPTKLNLTIYQGSTFSETIRWESSNIVYKSITNITKTAPMIITSSSHGLLSGWRARISNVLGMTEVNELGYITATAVDSNSITFGAVNAAGFKTYTSGGILEYNAPMDLNGYTARMQIREKLNSESVILELTSDDIEIILDNNNKTITIYIQSNVTATLNFKTAVYSLEVESGLNEVSTLLHGYVNLKKEVTR